MPCTSRSPALDARVRMSPRPLVSGRLPGAPRGFMRWTAAAVSARGCLRCCRFPPGCLSRGLKCSGMIPHAAFPASAGGCLLCPATAFPKSQRILK